MFFSRTSAPAVQMITLAKRGDNHAKVQALGFIQVLYAATIRNGRIHGSKQACPATMSGTERCHT
jgi:hypothetical protein